MGSGWAKISMLEVVQTVTAQEGHPTCDSLDDSKVGGVSDKVEPQHLASYHVLYKSFQPPCKTL